MQINLVVLLAVCQLVVVNQQPQIKEKRYVDNVDDSFLQYQSWKCLLDLLRDV